MSLINRSIPNLFNGISQQSASIRQPAQAELQENAYSSIVDGLHKRHPTKFLAKLSNSAPQGNPFIHVINRDAAEKYVLVINNGTLQVWDLDGNPKTVNIVSGASYINPASPGDDLTALTIADYTFLVNRRVVAKRTTGGSVGTATITFDFPWVGAYDRTDARIHLTVNGTDYVRQMTSGTSPDTYATHYRSVLPAALGPDYVVGGSGNTVTITAVTAAVNLGVSLYTEEYLDNYWDDPNQIFVTGWRETTGYATLTASGTVSYEVYSAYNKLPATGTAGTIYKITGDSDNAWAAYYCLWNGSSYVETVGTRVGNDFDAATMPHRLVRNADGTFTLSQISWDTRLVGDDVSNSPASFVDHTIQDMFFFRNRLGFLSGENVIFSRAGEFFNFWVETATQVLDTDPIDVSVSHVKVSNLKHAIPFNKTLLLFSELTQFTLTATDVLTPKTVSVHPSTEFECSKRVKPAVVGANVYFAVDKGDYSAIREYYVSPYTNTFDADDVTAHAPKYVPGAMTRMVATSNDDAVFALSPKEPNAIYVYKFYWKGEEKLQSSWSKWVLKSDAAVLNMEIMGTKLYLVIKKPDGLYLEYVDLQVALTETDLSFQVFLDRKVKLTGVYNAGTNQTTWTLPYAESGVQVILGGSFSGKAGAILTTSQPNSTTVVANGDFSGGTAYLGIPYTMRYRFSPQFVKDRQGQPISGTKLKLRNWRLIYSKSGYFRTEVTPQSRPTQVALFTGKVLGSSSIIGKVNITSGTFSFPVMTDGVTGVIEIVNDSYLPSFFQSAEWEGFYVQRAERM